MKKRTLAAAALACAAVAGTAVAAPAGAFGGPGVDTIAEALAARSGGVGAFDTNPLDYDILIDAAVNSGLAGAVTSPTTEVTLFAPNDLAFRTLVVDITGDLRFLFRSERAVAEAVQAVNRANPGLVDTVLSYHVVAPLPGLGTIQAAEALQADGAALPTLAGASFTVDVVNTRLPLVVLQDNDRDDLDAVLAQTRLDIAAGRSVIHGVTQVLRPADVGRVLESQRGNLPVRLH